MPGNMRWHLVPSKNFLLARNEKLSAEQGDFDRSMLMLILPKLVSTVIVLLPVLGGVVVGGTPTSLVVGVRSPLGTSFHTQLTGPADGSAAVLLEPSSPARLTSSTTPTASTITATPAPMLTCHWRRFLAAAARSAISFSSRARAAARCRSLVDVTLFLLGCGAPT